MTGVETGEDRYYKLVENLQKVNLEKPPTLMQLNQAADTYLSLRVFKVKGNHPDMSQEIEELERRISESLLSLVSDDTVVLPARFGHVRADDNVKALKEVMFRLGEAGFENPDTNKIVVAVTKVWDLLDQIPPGSASVSESSVISSERDLNNKALEVASHLQSIINTNPSDPKVSLRICSAVFGFISSMQRFTGYYDINLDNLEERLEGKLGENSTFQVFSSPRLKQAETEVLARMDRCEKYLSHELGEAHAGRRDFYIYSSDESVVLNFLAGESIGASHTNSTREEASKQIEDCFASMQQQFSERPILERFLLNRQELMASHNLSFPSREETKEELLAIRQVFNPDEEKKIWRARIEREKERAENRFNTVGMGLLAVTAVTSAGVVPFVGFGGAVVFGAVATLASIYAARRFVYEPFVKSLTGILKLPFENLSVPWTMIGTSAKFGQNPLVRQEVLKLTVEVYEFVANEVVGHHGCRQMVKKAKEAFFGDEKEKDTSPRLDRDFKSSFTPQDAAERQNTLSKDLAIIMNKYPYYASFRANFEIQSGSNPESGEMVDASYSRFGVPIPDWISRVSFGLIPSGRFGLNATWVLQHMPLMTQQNVYKVVKHLDVSMKVFSDLISLGELANELDAIRFPMNKREVESFTGAAANRVGQFLEGWQNLGPAKSKEEGAIRRSLFVGLARLKLGFKWAALAALDKFYDESKGA